MYTIMKQEALLVRTTVCVMQAKQMTFQNRGSNIWSHLPSSVRNAPLQIHLNQHALL